MKFLKFRWFAPTLFVSFCAAAFGQQFTVQIGSPPLPPTVLVNHTNVWRFHKGTNAPQAGWTNIADVSLDATWGTGAGGFGYADNAPETQLCQTLLPDMIGATNAGGGHYTTFYFRRSFDVTNAFDSAAHLYLTNDYDDGFIAFLDGAEVTRFNAGTANTGERPFASTTPNNTTHESSHGGTGASPPVVVDLGLANSRLPVGTHVLAIQGINAATNSSDFIQVVDLSVSGGTGTTTAGYFAAIVNTNSVPLSGTNTVPGSTHVVINGDDAAFASGTWSKNVSLAAGVNKLFIAALDSTGAILFGTNYIIVSELSSSNISGTLPSSSTWSGIIHLTSTAIVPPGGTLTINPGTVVLASSGASVLATNATLNALGTLGNEIYFLPSDGSSNTWGELVISGTSGQMLLQHIETIAGHIEVFNGAVGTLEDSSFHDYWTPAPAIIHTLGQPTPCTLNMRRCHVARYQEVLSQIATNHIEDCLCEYQGYSGDGIDFDDGQEGSYIKRCTVRRGLIFNTDAIDMGEFNGNAALGTRTLIDSCLLHDFIDKGVSMGVQVYCTVTNTLIYNCDAGIAVKDNSLAGVFNCTMANCNYGFHEYNKANPSAPNGGGSVTNSFNNIIWSMALDSISLLNGSTLIATYTDFQGTNYPGEGNIDADPLFLDAAAHDYRVANNSPTIGTGLNGQDMGVTFPVGGIPAVPLNLAVLSSGTNALKLIWEDDADNEDGFAIERSTDAVNWVGLTGLGPNVTNYTDSSAVLGQKYYYRVKTSNSSGDSPHSNIASGTRQAPVVSVGGTISGNSTWANGSHYIVTSAVTIASSATLTIQPGVTVCFNTGLGMTIANGGRLLAEGTSNAPILFTRSPSNVSTWTGLTIDGSVGSPETRIAYAHFEFTSQSPCLEVSAGTVFFDHLTFANNSAAYIHLDNGTSFIIQDCVFPTAAAGARFELVHGTGGIRSDGHGIFQRNFFGVANSVSGNYNDVLDFTGGNRPGPIIHFLNNVFVGATDDELDLDGTDAWIEGNIFLHAHKNGSPDTSSGVSGGDDSGNTSQITIIGNIFYDCDQAALAKQGNFYTFFNNTIVHQTHVGGVDATGAVVCVADDATIAQGLGAYFEGNVISDIEQLTRNITTASVTFSNNILPVAASAPAIDHGNFVVNPQFKHVPQLAETYFTNWADAQIMKDWLSLLPGSPGLGTGPNGRDKGAIVPFGASISGEPNGSTTDSNATLVVGIDRTADSIPVAGFPNGSGYTHYKWRLDTNAWSAETPINAPITLNNLASGPHYVEVTGKRDSGLYQDDPFFGVDALLTRSATWTVGLPALQIESVSRNGTTVTITFVAQAGQTYSLLSSDTLTPANWQKVPGADVGPQGATGLVPVVDNNATSETRFYQLVTPVRP